MTRNNFFKTLLTLAAVAVVKPLELLAGKRDDIYYDVPNEITTTGISGNNSFEFESSIYTIPVTEFIWREGFYYSPMFINSQT